VAQTLVAEWGFEDALAPIAGAAASGDTVAVRVLLEQVGPSVLAVIEAMLGRSNPDVDDVAQEVFVALVRAIKTFRYESSVMHFAKRIAIQRASAALRHRRAARRAMAATVALDDELFLPAQDVLPIDAVIAARQLSMIREVVADLPEEQAESLILRAVLGHSAEEISEITRTPLATVRSRLRAARATLRERMGEEA
jgi:RNA polymerase sigma-70 factor (ECF subfamily)